MSELTTKCPDATEYAPFYETYVSLVPAGDVVEILSRQLDELHALLASVPASKETEGYAPGKWSVRELVGHMCDTERVFAYRALCVARGDTANLPGMDQEVYAANIDYNAHTLSDLAEEFAHLRRATVSLFRRLDDAAWLRRGTANDNEVSTRALAHMLAGHAAHHMNVLRERYLSDQTINAE